ncbi:MAG: 4Fe-4S dicluster domain-containing protein [Deltaproteobacteria bacterium]|nr:MAG: 4Fe-4S dicluster domain-containing protein [Deltaproteobacteria bacterium]
MFFTAALYLSLAIFCLGLIYKVSTWFRYSLGLDSKSISTPARIFAALRGITLTLFSPKLFTLLKVFVLDVLLQVKVLHQDFLKWAMHMCIYYGFTLLLLMHGLDTIVTSALFPEYYSTINPFLFLRDFFGILVLLGVGIALYRRFILKVPRLRTSPMDLYAIIILAVIMFSGFLLEATKTTSYSKFQEMVEEYTIATDEEELRSLEAYWVAKFGVVSPEIKGPFDAKILKAGKEAHEMSCLQCHARPQWGFAGYTVATISKPVALLLDRARASTILWYIHFLACFVGLAYLPFSKMFHIFTTPLSLLANAVMEEEKSDPANIATLQMLELDACMHCGTCSAQCRVGVVFEEIRNVNILPSEKIPSIKGFVAGKTLSSQEIRNIQEGLFLCTNCYRCTVVCPAGINLQQLWSNVRESLLKKGEPEFFVLSPLSLYRGLMKDSFDKTPHPDPIELALRAVYPEGIPVSMMDRTLPLVPKDNGLSSKLYASVQANTFSHCYRCVTCTNACPVVRNYKTPIEFVGLLPHQIMHAAGMGLWELVFSSKMLWDCLGCYQCQEHCPQGVCVADVFYELKNIAIVQAREKLAKETKT